MASRVQNWDQSLPEPYIGLTGIVVYDPSLAQGRVAVKFAKRDLGTMHDMTYTVPAKVLQKIA